MLSPADDYTEGGLGSGSDMPLRTTPLEDLRFVSHNLYQMCENWRSNDYRKALGAADRCLLRA